MPDAYRRTNCIESAVIWLFWLTNADTMSSMENVPKGPVNLN